MLEPIMNMRKSNSISNSEIERLQFIKQVSLSSLSLVLYFKSCNFEKDIRVNLLTHLSGLKNVFDFEKLQAKVIGENALLYPKTSHDLINWSGGLNINRTNNLDIRAVDKGISNVKGLTEKSVYTSKLIVK